MMEQTSELKLSPQRLKHFFAHLAITQKRVSQRRKITSELSERIGRIKEMTTGPKKSAVMEELEKLEKKVSEIVEMQMKTKQESSSLMQKLQEKIEAIQPKPSARPFEDFEKISSRLAENVVKLSRIGEAEQKLEGEVAEEKIDIGKIEVQLKVLEQRFNELKKTKGAKKEDLQRIKNLIETHKKTIKEIKSK